MPHPLIHGPPPSKPQRSTGHPRGLSRSARSALSQARAPPGELGECFGIERFSDEHGRPCDLARLPKCRLRDTWHSVNSLLEKPGVPDSLRAAWLGHTIAVNRGAYPH